MAAIIAPPLPYFNTVNLFSNLKTVFFFVKKHRNFTQNVLKQQHMICCETALWKGNYRQIQNGGHDRPK